MVQPAEFSVRSCIYRTLEKEGAQFGEVANAAMALHYGGDIEHEVAQARSLGIADLSTLPRTGFKGRAAIAWLDAQDLQIGATNNQAYAQSDGSLVARLADTEALILGDLSCTSTRCGSLNNAWRSAQPAACFHVPRQDASAWFLLTGTRTSDTFAKICAIDLRQHKFPNGSIAQTSLARMNGIVIRGDLGDTPAFHLLFDSASSVYLWNCLRDAMAEFDGAPVGHNALLTL